MLLFLLCHWHGLAKLRMHTDDTLELMELVTAVLGNHLCAFTTETCTAFSTKELHHETEAWMRRQGRKSLWKHVISSSQQNNAQATAQKARTLNLQTYKLHALGDYTEQIWRYSTVDLYSTQTVSHQGLLICLSQIFWFSRASLSTILAKVDLLAPAERCSFHNLPRSNSTRHAPVISKQSWLLCEQAQRKASTIIPKIVITLAKLNVFLKTSCYLLESTQMTPSQWFVESSLLSIKWFEEFTAVGTFRTLFCTSRLICYPVYKLSMRSKFLQILQSLPLLM